MDCLYHPTLLLFLCVCSTSESADPLGQFCNKNTNISTAVVSENIEILFVKLVQTTTQNGSSAISYGNAQNQVYGLAQCRGDVSSIERIACIRDAAKEVRKRCPNQSNARIWYDFCFLRYDLKDFRAEVDTSYGIFYHNVENVKDPEVFNKNLGALMNKTNSQVVVPGNKWLGKGDSKMSLFCIGAVQKGLVIALLCSVLGHTHWQLP